MREIRSSGSVEGVVSNHDPYSDPLHITGRSAKYSREVLSGRRVHVGRGSEPSRRVEDPPPHGERGLEVFRETKFPVSARGVAQQPDRPRRVWCPGIRRIRCRASWPVGGRLGGAARAGGASSAACGESEKRRAGPWFAVADQTSGCTG